jgi:hypothetical protein
MGMLDEIDYGLMVLGADAQILHANQLARLELGGGRFIRLRQHKLAPSAARHGAKIEAALAKVGRGQRSLVTLGGTDRELALSFVPLNSSARSAAPAPDVPLALVILGKRDACEALTLQQYGHIHGLTGADRATTVRLSKHGAHSIGEHTRENRRHVAAHADGAPDQPPAHTAFAHPVAGLLSLLAFVPERLRYCGLCHPPRKNFLPTPIYWQSCLRPCAVSPRRDRCGAIAPTPR